MAAIADYGAIKPALLGDNMKIDDIERELDLLTKELRPLLDKQWRLNEALRKAKSLQYIKVNNISLSDVEMSSGDGKPYFGHIKQYGEWLKLNSDKPYCEWNEEIYLTSEIINGFLRSDGTGLVEDLK